MLTLARYRLTLRVKEDVEGGSLASACAFIAGLAHAEASEPHEHTVFAIALKNETYLDQKA